MSDPRFDDMMKATRLTQAGRLEEATTLLQRLLGVASPLRASSSEGRAANEHLKSSRASDISLPNLSATMREAARTNFIFQAVTRDVDR